MNAVLAFIPFVSATGDGEIPPLAPALLKSCLKIDGIDATCVDFNIRYRNWVNVNDPQGRLTSWMMQPDNHIEFDIFKKYKNFVNECVNELLMSFPDIIGISVFSQDSQRFAEDLCYEIKKRNPKQYIAIGGAGHTVLQFEYGLKWGELMLSQNLVDVVLVGEAEHIIGDTFKNKRTGIVKPESQLSSDELIDIPTPNFDDYKWNDYGNIKNIKLPVTGSKGCVRDCTFCDVAVHWPKFRHRTGESIANEIIEMHEKYGIKNFSFTDSLINGGMRPFREMNKVLSRELPRTINYNGQFICRGPTSMFSLDFLEMAEAGCSLVNIGIESGSERVRNHMRKKISDADLHYTAEHLLKNNITQWWNIITGYPTETDEDWNKTIDLINQYSLHNNLIKIIPIGVFQLLEGTPMVSNEMLEELSIDRHVTSGYSQFNWVSKINKSNTLRKRIKRWIELVDLLVKLDMLAGSKDRIERKKSVMLRQLEYYESDQDLSELDYESR
jgi:anaerobic magnesium-protoporphyrin IX monomethyl ester cyclase